MTSTAFISAVLALLLAPGPTNTLMGVAGAQRGLGGVVRLLPAELLGYLTTILPLIYLGAELLAHWPVAAVVLKVVAAAWVMFLAVKLWSLHGGAETYSQVTARRVYLTTMLNPKALIFGLVLLPAVGDPELMPRLGLFCLMVIAVALVWGTAGMLTQTAGGNSGRLLAVQRIASVWLAIVSVTLIVGAIGA
jgi:threonine/homoserine/homoserine lactone efflux protein